MKIIVVHEKSTNQVLIDKFYQTSQDLLERNNVHRVDLVLVKCFILQIATASKLNQGGF